jgi:hypothetical protein
VHELKHPFRDGTTEFLFEPLDFLARLAHHWLAALEKIVADKGMASAGELSARKHAWDEAARATPHGQPIVLDASDDS